MKVFDLVCASGHRFEGWFASAEQFGAQSAAAGVLCPICDSSDVHREPSAPRLNLSASAVGAASSPARPAASASAGPDPATVFAQLRELIARTENVGPRFAEEARRIHYDETPARPIRGTTTDRERRDLHDEGIETLTLPVPRALTETMQ